MMWALELGAVATSNDIANRDGRNRSQHQSRLTRSTPLLWGAKALTRQASKTQWGRPWQSASKPQGGLADKCNKCVMRLSWLSWQYSSCDNNYCHRSINCCNASTIDARRRHSTRETLGRLGKFMPQISCNEHGINNKAVKKNLQAEQKRTKNEAVVTRTPCVTCTTIAGQAMNRVTWESQGHRPQWQKNTCKRGQQKTPFWQNSFNKRCLLFNALAWP